MINIHHFINIVKAYFIDFINIFLDFSQKSDIILSGGDTVDINQRAKKVRKLKGLTQSDFAAAIGLKQNTVASYETDRLPVSERTFKAICQTFDVDEIWLRTGEGQPFREQTKDEVLAEVFSKAKIGDDARDRLVRAFARLPVEDYAAMEKILLHIIERLEPPPKNPQEIPSTEKETP